MGKSDDLKCAPALHFHRRNTPSVCSRWSQPPSPRGRLLAVAGKFPAPAQRRPLGGAGEHSEPEGVALGMTGKFAAQPQSLWTCLLPLGGAVAQRLRGYEWRSEKSVKAIAPTGAALAFLCFDFFFRIVKGEQPLATGCGTQHPLRALGGTRVLLAAAPTTAPCFRRWRRSQLLHCGVGGVQR